MTVRGKAAGGYDVFDAAQSVGPQDPWTPERTEGGREEEGEDMVAEPWESPPGLALVLGMGVSRHSQID